MTALMQAADGLYAPVTPRNRCLIYAMLAGLRPGAITRLDTDDLTPAAPPPPPRSGRKAAEPA
ncbi:hypothetical protein ACFQ2B_40280 [Streptomyces stramineus]